MRLEVICGPMFAGKTEELIRRVKRCTLSGKSVQVFKPHIDSRYGKDKVQTHSKTDLEVSTGVKPQVVDCRDRFERISIRNDTRVIAFDEVQFFPESWIVPVVEGLLKDGIRIICAGLDLNTYGEPFGCVPALLARADEIIKLKAICVECGEDANRTFREIPFSHGGDVEVGGMGIYQPRCLDCWEPTPR